MIRSFSIILFTCIVFQNHGQDTEQRSIITNCDAWGEQDWSLYESTLSPLHVKFFRMGNREEDKNLKVPFRFPSPILFYGNELTFRWFLDDTSIEYAYRLDDFSDKRYTGLKSEGCSFLINTDTFLTENNRTFGVAIERANKESYNWGVQHVLTELKQSDKDRIKLQLKDCESLDCRINVFMNNDLFFDALTLFEKQALKQNSPELREKYWRACNEVRIALKDKKR